MTNSPAFLLTLPIVWLSFSSSFALGFPESIRHGYVSCTSCHISPSGGGILSPYGRFASSEALVGTSATNEGAFAYGMLSQGREDGRVAEGLDLAVNLRTLSAYQDRGAYRQYRNLLMQADVQAAYTLEKWTIALAAGLYGSTAASPYHYVLYNISKEVSVRAGRFLPFMGIPLPDHNVGTRRGLGWDQGDGTYNAEIGYASETFTTHLTAIFAAFPMEFGAARSGASLRSAVISGNSQIGFTYAWTLVPGYTQHTVGPFVLWGPRPDWYFLLDVRWRRESPRTVAADLTENSGLFSYLKIGHEFIKGYHLYITGDGAIPSWKTRSSRGNVYYGLGFQFLPRPHIDGTLQAGVRRVASLSSSYHPEATLMLHYQL